MAYPKKNGNAFCMPKEMKNLDESRSYSECPAGVNGRKKCSMAKTIDTKEQVLETAKNIREQPEISVTLPFSLWCWLMTYLEETANDREKEIKHWTEIVQDPHAICTQTAKDTLEFWKSMNKNLEAIRLSVEARMLVTGLSSGDK